MPQVASAPSPMAERAMKFLRLSPMTSVTSLLNWWNVAPQKALFQRPTSPQSERRWAVRVSKVCLLADFLSREFPLEFVSHRPAGRNDVTNYRDNALGSGVALKGGRENAGGGIAAASREGDGKQVSGGTEKSEVRSPRPEPVSAPGATILTAGSWFLTSVPALQK